ncbi:hypothetical protein [Acinetobacter vivianii]|uniref:hypothetical protein n=1 Tax=Acinetobacter vivianii TaxID=1776742 RepID=UPI003D07F8ED
MKKIVLFLILIGTGSTAFAVSDYELAQSYCKTAETVAGFAQGSRQLGKKASETTSELMAMASAYNDPEARARNEKQIFFIVQHAYQVPIYPTQEMRKKAVKDFEEINYLVCIQSFQKAIDQSNKK